MDRDALPLHRRSSWKLIIDTKYKSAQSPTGNIIQIHKKGSLEDKLTIKLYFFFAMLDAYLKSASFQIKVLSTVADNESILFFLPEKFN